MQFLNRNREIFSELWRKYVNEERLIFAPLVGNYEDKSTIFPRARVMASVIQYFVR